MTQATILMGAFGLLVIVGSSMGCPGFITPWTPYDPRRTIAKECTKNELLIIANNVRREVSRCLPRSPEGISYSFNDIR